ncbi:hypothetical protein LOC68_15170 [Blastopirellula sp. JC732]|uniref:Uncharacterized protein n=1 Tax=Blastopirellula sediminis TaxID=2894196 RepID=A0A9X1MNC6_9BACT|nr:hypothetical protein [Blastopirellula sediminis]MCC9606974.1 hypothetical protein [Blastopirellula sediminis]MCC9629731.1 hypothetical protein [Blastopirellula sediminis]
MFATQNRIAIFCVAMTLLWSAEIFAQDGDATKSDDNFYSFMMAGQSDKERRGKTPEVLAPYNAPMPAMNFWGGDFGNGPGFGYWGGGYGLGYGGFVGIGPIGYGPIGYGVPYSYPGGYYPAGIGYGAGYGFGPQPIPTGDGLRTELQSRAASEQPVKMIQNPRLPFGGGPGPIRPPMAPQH